VNDTSTTKRGHRLFSWRVWLLILVVAALVLSVFALGRRPGSKRVAVDIRLNKNGIPTILGIPLGNGAVRDVTLHTLGEAKVPVRFMYPSGGSVAPGWDTNSVEALHAIIKAGLIPTNPPAGPSPYE